MKLATFSAVALVFSAGYAVAGAGAPVPEGSQQVRVRVVRAPFG